MNAASECLQYPGHLLVAGFCVDIYLLGLYCITRLLNIECFLTLYCLNILHTIDVIIYRGEANTMKTIHKNYKNQIEQKGR